MVSLVGHFVEGDVAGGGAGENVHDGAGDAPSRLQPVAGGHLPVRLPGGDQGRSLDSAQAVQRMPSITRNTILKGTKGDDLALPCIPETSSRCYRVLFAPYTRGSSPMQQPYCRHVPAKYS